MGAKLLQTVITSIILPLLKDLAFMLFNMFKVRQIRKEKEVANKAAAEAYAAANTPEAIKDTFGQLP